jgi:TPR repeat protein
MVRTSLRVLAIAAGLTAWAAAAQADFAAGLAAYDGGDYATALAEWRPLAETGDSDAQVALAGLYLLGHGTRADAAEAMHWYRRAAEAGNAVAQLNLGDAYARGLGVPIDPINAYVWLGLAAAQGRNWAQARRDGVAKTMRPAEVAEAEVRLAKWRAEH